jgi:hypothetical protein
MYTKQRTIAVGQKEGQKLFMLPFAIIAFYFHWFEAIKCEIMEKLTCFLEAYPSFTLNIIVSD